MVTREFQALMIEDQAGRGRGGLVRMTEAQLDPGEVTLEVAWSSINYKDALAATGTGKVVRRFPCVGGIDLAGRVLASTDARFAVGDEVLATGYELGVAHHGGYAELARVPADWLVPLPAGLDMRTAMALGTAGFTAALALHRMELNGLAPGQGPVVVTGASGGVGSLALGMLARRGYQVVAMTGKADARAYLQSLGASEVLLRETIDLTQIKPLGRASWAGAVDTLGGGVLAWLLSQMREAGTVASIGLAASHELHATVMPFILRGVSLLGIDSVNCPLQLRAQIWQRLAQEWRPQGLEQLVHEVGLADLPLTFAAYLQGQVRGRTVVKVGG